MEGLINNFAYMYFFMNTCFGYSLLDISNLYIKLTFHNECQGPLSNSNQMAVCKYFATDCMGLSMKKLVFLARGLNQRTIGPVNAHLIS